jgi:hypothetical protein
MAATFKDLKNYPHGFQRSGDFSIKEADRIQRYGLLFQQLTVGNKTPETAEEKDFYDQLNGNTAITSPEILAWHKYLKKISAPKQYFPLCSTPHDIDDKKSKGSNDDDADDDMDVDVSDPLEDDDDMELEDD